MDFAGLQAAVGDFLNRGDVYPQIPTFIAMAEARMNRRLRVKQMMVNAQANVASEFETAPTDMLQPISLKLSTNNTPLDCIAPDAMAARKNQGDGQPGTPKAYSLVGASLEFSPAPDTAYLAYLVYYGQIPSLSAINTTNWLISAAPDVYLYGVLSQGASHVKDGRAALWGGLFEQALEELEVQDRRSSYGARLEPKTSLVV